ncbi:linalool dehydratase/isomerase domain-containing protein [Mycobacterium sp.]|uniref:linalool dehydratase/isomerase domain-containing protein n=1 Tax=Mycobacterium sp. TaxID=1785 RepID=UPI003F9E191F
MTSDISPRRTTDFPPAERGPLTRGRLRRTAAVYAAVIAIGAALLAVGSPPWQVLGVGLWYPGAGFLALGGWHWVLTIVTLVVFGFSLVAWFAAGACTFPPLVWFAAAAIASMMTGSHISRYGVVVAIALALAAIAIQLVRKTIARARAARTRAERIAYLPTEQIAVRERAVPAPAKTNRELDAETLAGLRYIFDRALQDVHDFSNFDKIDQFQTAAIRYQINQLGYALAQVSFHYTPAFGGYSHDAQNRLVEKYLERLVWSYWRWENTWGRMSLDADPAKIDNIMLTGYLGLQVFNLTAATGDHRWNRQGALSFRVNDRKVYRHDGHSLLEQLMRNFRTQHFTLWPCEPNWIYPACNCRGAMAVRSYDRLFGTRNWDEIAQAFKLRLETEFTNPDGSVVALRSRGTGFAVPVPMPDAVVPQLINPLYPAMADRYWAIARHDNFEAGGNGLRVKPPAMTIDYGNYRPSVVSNVAALVNGAKEMGDEEATKAAVDELNQALTPVYENGALFFRGVSNLWNTWIAQDRTAFKDCWRSLIVEQPPACITEGPQLAHANYPDVLVATARNDGHTLRLVLRPGGSSPRQDLTLARLRPGMRYRVIDGQPERQIVAAADGTAVLSVDLRDRLEVLVTPAD